MDNATLRWLIVLIIAVNAGLFGAVAATYNNSVLFIAVMLAQALYIPIAADFVAFHTDYEKELEEVTE